MFILRKIETAVENTWEWVVNGCHQVFHWILISKKCIECHIDDTSIPIAVPPDQVKLSTCQERSNKFKIEGPGANASEILFLHAIQKLTFTYKQLLWTCNIPFYREHNMTYPSVHSN